MEEFRKRVCVCIPATQPNGEEFSTKEHTQIPTKAKISIDRVVPLNFAKDSPSAIELKPIGRSNPASV